MRVMHRDGTALEVGRCSTVGSGPRFCIEEAACPSIAGRAFARSSVPVKPGADRTDDADDGLAIDDETTTDVRQSRIVDSAIYVDGERVASPGSLAETYRRASAACPDGMAWIGLYRPEEHEVASLAAEFQLHALAVEDAIRAHQRPKIERYDDTLFVVLRPARYVDEIEEVEFGEIHIFVGPKFVLTVRHSEAPEFAAVRHRLEEPARAVATRARGGALRDPGQGGRRLLPRRRRPRQRHRRDRDRGVQRRPEGVAAHLRAVPRGRRLPAGHVAR